MNKIDYQVFLIVFDKKNKFKINYDYNYNKLYNILSSCMAKQLDITHSTDIIIDRSKNKEEDIIEFNRLFLENLKNNNSLNVSIHHENSVAVKGLQIIDLIAWAMFQSVEHKNDEFISIVVNKKLKLVFED